VKAALVACLLAACVERAPTAADAARDGGAIPVACDGGLCATDNGSSCSAAHADPSSLAGMVAALAALARRRRR
jgi:uncharacterized protein (TIGR03382 family)